jgi:(p)ppGpp synthase/HD superfamily hydrolase
MAKIDEAIAFAAIAHADQRRKYTGDPYIVHPVEVMQILRQDSGTQVSEEQCIAAVLHDVVEDTPVTLSSIERRFGETVAALVFDLTEQVVPGNRKVRKEAERQRLATISPAAQSIKYADLISNTKSIVEYDADFARVYLAEKSLILEVMTEGDESLYRKAYESLIEGQTEIVRRSLQ